MGRRGRNRTGYYVAVLYVLELQYEREERLKGPDPLHWSPSPRNRPDQFCFWALDALRTLNTSEPADFAELLADLQARRLARVACVLEHVVRRQVLGEGGSAGPNIYGLSVPQVLEWIGHDASSAERHPQARKFANAVTQQLDRAWLDALRRTSEEYLSMEELPRVALLLGGLPPDFRALNERIFGHLEDTDLILEHRTLTAVQFYGLVTGTAPPAPSPWQEALGELYALTEEETEILAHLSETQASQVRCLSGDGGWKLWILRRRLACDGATWRALGEILRSPDEDARNVPPRLRELADRMGAFTNPDLEDPSRQRTMDLAATPVWNVIADLDPEVERMLRRDELRPALLSRVRDWSDDAWDDVRHLLQEHQAWCVALLQDWRLLDHLFESRTGARLNLRDLFPETVAWLDDFLHHHLEEALVRDVGDLETFATLVSRRIRENLWLQPDSVLLETRDLSNMGL